MTLTVVGDICLDSIDAKSIVIDDEIKSILLSSSISIGNLEGPVTACEDKRELMPIHLKSEMGSQEVLKYFAVLSLANNHMFDYGISGFKDTVDFLQQNNIYWLGAGRNANEAKRPLTIEKDVTQKIAVITGTRWSNARLKLHGTASFKGNSGRIRNLKSKGYFVIYFPHWGYEYILTPPPDVRNHARNMIKLGVDLVIGTHPHILQGFEEYNNKYIFYSLGNFIFHPKHIEALAPIDSQVRAKTSIVLKLYLKNGSVDRFNLHPIAFSEKKIELIRGVKKEEIIDNVYKMSEVFKESKISYLKKYYSQVPRIVEQNRKIRNDFQKIKKLRCLKKILLFKDFTKQDLLNRLASSLFN